MTRLFGNPQISEFQSTYLPISLGPSQSPEKSHKFYQLQQLNIILFNSLSNFLAKNIVAKKYCEGTIG